MKNFTYLAATIHIGNLITSNLFTVCQYSMQIYRARIYNAYLTGNIPFNDVCVCVCELLSQEPGFPY